MLTVDEVALRAEVRELAAESASELARVDAVARELEPYYRAMLERAHQVDVGMHRWAGPMVP
jgi:5-methylthioadenosine/S-adenosylhomocysteine deaminase